MSFESWQIGLGVAGLLVACIGPTVLWAAHMRADGRWQGRMEEKLDAIPGLLSADRAERDRVLAAAQREHDQIRELALSAHRKVDRLGERLAGSAGG